MLVERHRAHAQLGGELADRNRSDSRPPSARRERGEDPFAHRIRGSRGAIRPGIRFRGLFCQLTALPNASNRKILSLLWELRKGNPCRARRTPSPYVWRRSPPRWAELRLRP